jgi:hypothetical protein
MTHARGPFDVKMTPHPGLEPPLAHMSLEKRYRGDLDAEGRGEMLSAGTAAAGSAGYVAIERVAGTLGGKTGSFVLQHSGTMNRGQPSLSITVVPDSGTGELAGLSGNLGIDIREGGAHFYDFDYAFPGEGGA